MTVSLSPVDDATSYLTAPNVPGSGNFIWQLRMQSGIIIGGLDAVVSAITGFSPLEEWVAKPLGGDWDALDRGAVAWTGAGKAAKAVATNLDALPGQIGDAWTGKSADEFAKAHAKVASSIAPLPGACDSMSQMCSALAEMARAIAEFVAEILKDLSYWALKMLASAAVPVAGEVAMGGWLAELGIKIGTWVPKLAGMISKFVAFVAKIAPIVEKIRKVVEMIDKILSKLAGIMKIVDAGTRSASAALA